MADSWAEAAVNNFFSGRLKPTRNQCNEKALAICNSSSLRSVEVPGSLSYTVICFDTQGEGPKNDANTLVVSFRESGSGISEDKLSTARGIHGSLVPTATDHGLMTDSDPPLRIYTMPLLPGTACIEVLSAQAEMGQEEVLQHISFVKHLARYFARCWCAPQTVDICARTNLKEEISSRMKTLRSSPRSVVTASQMEQLERILPSLFETEYPQVLTHGDFSQTNVLVNPHTFEITGIVDWSLASVQPFGMELDCLYLFTGCMDRRGWHDYACRSELWKAFWAEFWVSLEVQEKDKEQRERIHAKAEAAAKIGAILRYAFDRNPDGSPSSTLSTSETMLQMVKAFCN